MKRNIKKRVPLALLVLPELAMAAGANSSCQPWEKALAATSAAPIAPVALSIAITALMAVGGTLLFGRDLNEYSRRACIAVLAVAFLVAGTASWPYLACRAR